MILDDINTHMFPFGQLLGIRVTASTDGLVKGEIPVAVFPHGGHLLAEEAEGVLAYSRSQKTIAVLGLDDLVVVNTEDAILVAPRARAEEVKRFVERLQDEGNSELL